MDIVTHGMMGIALAGPAIASHPAGAAGFILGSVAPDLDAFSRCLGKRAFLTWHQGITHGLPLIAGVGLLAQALRSVLPAEIVEGIFGFCLGATLHVLLDLTNTYGVRAFAPLLARRYCLEWLFFIDSVVILLTIPAALFAAITLDAGSAAASRVAMAYGGSLILYIAIRAILHTIGRRRCPDHTTSMIPSALWPWKYMICVRDNEVAQIMELNALTGRTSRVGEYTIYDQQIRAALEDIPEFRAMADLSPAYHVVELHRTDTEISVRCRDLRTVNFDTKFGMLEITLDRQQKPISVFLHV